MLLIHESQRAKSKWIKEIFFWAGHHLLVTLNVLVSFLVDGQNT